MTHPTTRLIIPSVLALCCAAACALDPVAPPPRQNATGGSSGAGNPTGGVSSVGGSSTGGVAGTATSGGTGQTGGTSGGTPPIGGSAGTGVGGTTGGDTGAGGSGGTAPDLSSVASVLDGYTMLLPCGQQTETRVCSTSPGGGCPNDADPALDGSRPTDETLTLGGDASTQYDVTLHIQGLVEAKNYQGGADQDSSGDQIPADGFYVGGAPGGGNNYNVYMIRVTAPAEDYFLNSVGVGNDSRVRHSLFEMDYQATIRVQGGTTLRMVAADSNCSAIKNCEDPDVGSVCNPITYDGLDPMILSDIEDNPYNGQFVGMRVVSVVVAQ